MAAFQDSNDTAQYQANHSLARVTFFGGLTGHGFVDDQ